MYSTVQYSKMPLIGRQIIRQNFLDKLEYQNPYNMPPEDGQNNSGKKKKRELETIYAN